MLPHLHLGPIIVPMFSLMITWGIVSAFLYIYYEVIRRYKFDKQSIIGLIVTFVLSVLALGGFALVTNSIYHSISEKRLVIGGITWLGGLLGMIPVTYLCLRYLVPIAKGKELFFFSKLIPAILIGRAFGRIGCFFGGCCYGKVTDSIFGIIFPAGSPAAHEFPNELTGESLPVLPTQLFEAVFDCCLLLTIFFISRSGKIKKNYFSVYCIGYGLFRFLIEFLRGDDRGTLVIPLSPSQINSILLICLGVIAIQIYRKQKDYERSLA